MGLITLVNEDGIILCLLNGNTITNGKNLMWSNNEWMFYLQVLMVTLFALSAVTGIMVLGFLWGMLRAYLVEKKMRKE